MSSDPLTTLGTADRNRLEALLVEFDLDWAPDRLAAFVERLPAAGGLRAAGLRELVRIDRERQARGGQPVAWEDYLKHYPELLDTSLPLTPPAPASTIHGPLVGGELPEEFGRYRILRPLGRGGMGRVYLARDTELDRLVALKVPHFGPGDVAAAERFAREARAAAAIDHPNVCRVYDVGRIDGIQFLTMAYVNGRTLADEMHDAPLAPRRAAEVVRDVARGMAEAHRLGVVHRDLKPGNILLTGVRGQESGVNKATDLTPNSCPLTPVITDFGLARRTADDQRLTTSGTVLGTPLYMSPEQVAGDVERVGPASDVYSLGVVLYELLAGRPPFGMDRTEIMAGTLSGDPPPPSSVRREVDPRLDAVVLTAMAKRAADRPDMARLADALDDWLTGGGPKPARRPKRRWLVGAAVAVGLLLILPAGVQLGWFGGPRGPGPEEKKVEKGLKGEQGGGAKANTTVGEGMADPKVPTEPRPLGTGALVDPGDRLTAVGFSPDGKQVHAAARNGGQLVIRRWDAAAGTPVGEPLELLYNWATFAAGGRHVLVGGGLHYTELLRVSDGERMGRFETGANCQAGAVSRDGRLVLLGLEPAVHVARVYDPTTGQPLKDAAQYAAHGKDFKFVVLSDDGRWAYSVSPDREAVWEVATGKPAFEPGSGEPVRAATFIPGTTWFASGNGFGQIAVLDMLKPNEFLHYSNGHDDAVTCMTTTPDGKLLLSGGDDQAVRAWHPARNEQKWALTELGAKVVALAVSPDGKRLVAGFANNSWRTWELPAGK